MTAWNKKGQRRSRRQWLLFAIVITACDSAITHAAISSGTDPTVAVPVVLDEVVITAQKRSQNLQSTPISVATIAGAALEQSPLANTGDLARYVPGLLIGKSAFVGQTYLRGVGQSNGVPGVESPVATYLDGVYLGAPALAVFDLSNISQVDVLRGPQGTLFGRNATGGLIQITTKEPNVEFGGSAQVGYANFNTLTGQVYVTGPVTPAVSASLAIAGTARQDGYIRNVTNGTDLLNEKKYTVQNKWFWEATDRTSIKLNLVRGEYRNLPGAVYGVYPGTLAADGVTSYINDQQVAIRDTGTNESNTTIASATVLTDLDWGRASSQTSFVSFSGELVLDQSAHPGQPNPNQAPAQISDLYAHIKSWTEEFQIQAPAAADFQWIAGFFYLRDVTNIDLKVNLDERLLTRLTTRVATDSYSLFGQVTKPLGERVNLTVGLRYTRDDRSFDGVTNTGAVPASSLPNSKSWPKLTSRLAVDYEFTPDVLGYVSYNRGFRSGIYTNTAVNVPPAAPETVDAYEVGLKTQLLDDRLRINGAAFRYDYNDLQLRTVVGPTILTYNAANSRVYGLDADVNAVISEHVTASAGLEMLHARYTEFPNGPVNVPTPLLAVPAGCTGALNPRKGGAALIACDLTGRDMVKAPALSATFGVQYETALAGGDAVFKLQDRYSSRYYFEPDNVLQQRPYHWVDASVAWSPYQSAWKLTLWGTNVTDARVFDTAVTAGNSSVYAPGSPAMYGVTVNVVF